MTWYFDSHIHLSDPEYVSDMEFTLKQMEFLKIKACCVSMDYKSIIMTRNPGVKNIVDWIENIIHFSSILRDSIASRDTIPKG